MPIRAVTFDLDGLMFNTEDIYDDVGQAVLARRGHVLTHELRCQMMGRRAREAIRCMIDFHGLSDSVEALIEECDTHFHELLRDRLAPMPGLLDLLHLIERRGLTKAVATSSARSYMEHILNRFEMLSRFDFTLAAEDVEHGKPHPEIYLTAAARHGIDPSQMLVLEDSHTGSLAAARAGAVVISIPTSHSAHQDFSHVTHRVACLDDPLIRALIEG